MGCLARCTTMCRLTLNNYSWPGQHQTKSRNAISSLDLSVCCAYSNVWNREKFAQGEVCPLESICWGEVVPVFALADNWFVKFPLRNSSMIKGTSLVVKCQSTIISWPIAQKRWSSLKLRSTKMFVVPLILIWEKPVSGKAYPISNNISLDFFKVLITMLS